MKTMVYKIKSEYRKPLVWNPNRNHRNRNFLACRIGTGTVINYGSGRQKNRRNPGFLYLFACRCNNPDRDTHTTNTFTVQSCGSESGSMGFICAFGPPGSGSVIQRYGSGSFYQKIKIRKTLLRGTVLCVLLDF
jgi:hypothetical protein